jgi:hypothetical protein
MTTEVASIEVKGGVFDRTLPVKKDIPEEDCRALAERWSVATGLGDTGVAMGFAVELSLAGYATRLPILGRQGNGEAAAAPAAPARRRRTAVAKAPDGPPPPKAPPVPDTSAVIPCWPGVTGAYYRCDGFSQKYGRCDLGIGHAGPCAVGSETGGDLRQTFDGKPTEVRAQIANAFDAKADAIGATAVTDIARGVPSGATPPSAKPIDTAALRASVRDLSYIRLPDLTPPPGVTVDGHDDLSDLPIVRLDDRGAGWVGGLLAEADRKADEIEAQAKRLVKDVEEGCKPVVTAWKDFAERIRTLYREALVDYVTVNRLKKSVQYIDLLPCRISFRDEGGDIALGSKDEDVRNARDFAETYCDPIKTECVSYPTEPELKWGKFKAVLKQMGARQDKADKTGQAVIVDVVDKGVTRAAVVPGVRWGKVTQEVSAKGRGD